MLHAKNTSDTNAIFPQSFQRSTTEFYIFVSRSKVSFTDWQTMNCNATFCKYIFRYFPLTTRTTYVKVTEKTTQLLNCIGKMVYSLNANIGVVWSPSPSPLHSFMIMIQRVAYSKTTLSLCRTHVRRSCELVQCGFKCLFI